MSAKFLYNKIHFKTQKYKDNLKVILDVKTNKKQISRMGSKNQSMS